MLLGTAASSDVINAEAQLLAAQAAAINVGVQRAQAEHAIALLIGKTPSEVSIPPASLAERVPIVPTNIPSALLERRPDIAEAERQMQQENALIGVQVAAYYPTIDLSAFSAMLESRRPHCSLLPIRSGLWWLAPVKLCYRVDNALRQWRRLARPTIRASPTIGRPSSPRSRTSKMS